MLTWQDQIPWETVKDRARYYNLDKDLVAAILYTESSCNEYAIRYEPTWRYRLMPYKFARLCNITEETEVFLQCCSIGIMQVMGTVARELGLEKSLLSLTNAYIGIDYGCRYLYRQSKRYSGDDLIASYNAGKPIKLKNGSYMNQDYVNKVNFRIGELKDDEAN